MRTKQRLSALRKRLLTAMHPVALLLFAACLPLLNACRTNDLPGMDSDDTPTTTPEELVGKPVCFGGLTVTEVTTDAATRVTTRTATDYNEPGATITVRMTVTPTGNGKSGTGSTTTYADYTCTAEGYWIPVDKPLYWADATSQHTFIAYSPALSNEEKKTGGRTTISLPQTWIGSLYDYYSEYMRSADLKTTPVPSVSLTLNLLLARVQVSMQDDATTYGQNLTMLMKTRGTLSADGTVSVPADADSPVREVSLWKDGNVFRGYLLPGQAYAQGETILCYGEGGTTNSKLYKATAAITAAVGNQLNFTVVALPGFTVDAGNQGGGLKAAIEAYEKNNGGTCPPRIVITGKLDINDMRTLAALGDEGKIVSVDMKDASVEKTAFGDDPFSNPKAANIPFYSGTSRAGIKNLILPRWLKAVPRYAFYNYLFDNVVLPESLEALGHNALYTRNSTVEVPATFNQPSSGNDRYYSAFVGYSRLTTAIVHCPLEKLGELAFRATPLSQIILKDDALKSTAVKSAAFRECTNLSSLDFLPSSVTTLEENAFYGCGFTSLDIPAHLTKVGIAAFSYCSNLRSVTVRARMDEWGRDIFSNTSQLTQITFADDALLTEKFSDDVFSSCTGLTSIELPPKITEISSGQYSYLFSGCSNLKKIAIDGSIAITGKLPQPQYGPKSAELFLYNPSLGQTGDHVTNFAGDTDWAEHSWANVHWGYKGSGDKFDATNYKYHKKTN